MSNYAPASPESPERCREQFDRHEYLAGLRKWFSLPAEVRDAAVDEAIQAGLDAPDDYLPLVLDSDGEDNVLSKDAHWVLSNFALLTSPTALALLDSENHEPITYDYRHREFSDHQASEAQTRFTELVDRKRDARIAELEGQGLSRREARSQVQHLVAEGGEAADFTAPNDFIRRHFSVDEMRDFINSVLDKTPPTEALAELFNVYNRGVVSMARHQELLLDDTLLDRLPRKAFPEIVEREVLGDLLAVSLRGGGPLPSIALIEKLMSLKPDHLHETSFKCADLNGEYIDMPIGAVYMGLVRRVMHKDDDPSRSGPAEPYGDALAKTADYLSSPVFMSQLRIYVASNAQFNDVLWRGKGSPRFNNHRAFEGRPPQVVKLEWLQEVVDIVVAHLVEAGNTDRAEMILANTK